MLYNFSQFLQSKKIVIVSIVVVLAALIILVSYSNPNSIGALPEAYYGKPAISTDHPIINKRIEQVLDDGQRMYILYDTNDGIVQVCDTNGAYQYTLVFYSNLNGAFTIATENQTLYVQDMRENVYIFESGEFEKFLEREEAKTQLKHIRFDPSNVSDKYEVRSGSIWKVSDAEEMCVVEGPSFTNRTINTMATLLLIVILLWRFYQLRRR